MVTILQIPNETLSLIISFLKSSDRLTCIQVCRSWFRIISSSVLYQELKFDENFTRFHKAIDFFDAEEQHGQTVSRLASSTIAKWMYTRYCFCHDNSPTSKNLYGPNQQRELLKSPRRKLHSSCLPKKSIIAI
jgi:hypothetical protein